MIVIDSNLPTSIRQMFGEDVKTIATSVAFCMSLPEHELSLIDAPTMDEGHTKNIYDLKSPKFYRSVSTNHNLWETVPDDFVIDAVEADKIRARCPHTGYWIDAAVILGRLGKSSISCKEVVNILKAAWH
ncbi:hypothetical protein [uncultured Photobacterium sp.]|uniref:hypothetical protein n=1 Tax=uncultured Photobacterium sp. TaxID=173973 RepID=UPI00262000FA|nr:hypothetical protein [uncultured Photobacterium sp.]